MLRTVETLHRPYSALQYMDQHIVIQLSPFSYINFVYISFCGGRGRGAFLSILNL